MRTRRGRRGGGRGIGLSIAFVLAVVFPTALFGAPLDRWILEKIEDDEQKLRWALRGENGYDVEMFPFAIRYIPFFLEIPASIGDVGEARANALRSYFDRQRSGLLPGGHLLRIRFGNNLMLYRLSGGTWGDGSWYSPFIGKEMEIEPGKVWAGDGGSDYLYATVLSGVPPRLIVYNRSGEPKEEKAFDLSDPNLSATMNEAAKLYSVSGEPALEVVSLAEYLREDEPLWRQVEITSSFSFRNPERPEEIQQLSDVGTLTRGEAKSRLRLRAGESVRSGERDREDKVASGRNRDPGDETKKARSEPAAKSRDGGAAAWLFVVGALAVGGAAVVLIRALLRARS